MIIVRPSEQERKQAVQIKEIWTDEICLRCRVRHEKIQAVKSCSESVQQCKCTRSKYFCWLVDSVMEGERNGKAKG